MNNNIIQGELKSIEEEIRVIKMKINKNLSQKKFLSSIKDMFPQNIDYDEIKKAEFNLKNDHFLKL